MKAPVVGAWLLIAAILIGRLLLQLGLYASGFEALTADDFGRIVIAAIWARNPQPITYGPWLPTHAYFHGLMLQLRWELLWLPRLATIAFGLASIVVMFALALALFKNRRIALISTALLALNPAHIWLSSVPLTEIMQATALLAFALCCTRWLEREKVRDLYASAALLCVATTIRFEAWLVGVLFSGLLLVFALRCSHWRAHCLIGLGLVWLFPLAWVVSNYTVTGDPLYFLTSNRAFDSRWYGQAQSYAPHLNTALKLDPIATLAIVPAFVACALTYRRSRRVVWYLALTVGATLLYAVVQRGYIQPPGNFIRYLAIFLFLAYPVVAWFGDVAVRRIVGGRRGQVVVLSAALAGIALVQTATTFGYVNDPAAEGMRVGQTLRRLWVTIPDQNANTLIELNHFQYLAMHVGANSLDRLIYDRPLDWHALNETPTALTPAVLRACDRKYQFGYVVMRDPRLRRMVETTLPVRLTDEINGYAIYALDRSARSHQQEDANGSCPLVIGTGY